MRVARRVEVEGIVQGVGFRPFINRLAAELGLAGEVANRTGGVTVVVEGDADAAEAFVDRLPREAPPIAEIRRIETTAVAPRGLEGFEIGLSRADGAGAIHLPPDIATCPDCARETADPTDRRFGYAFTNCTNCGPRFTIVRSLPYDRTRTTMDAFPLCPACHAEYTEIRDRRYHAEPVACPLCGPRLAFARAEGPADASEDALLRARAALAAGEIVAVKGLGGFHLACDAAHEAAVLRLRARKRREAKPLAVLFRDLEAARACCVVDPEAERLLTGPRAPIVLCPKREAGTIAHAVAPDSGCLGALLPYTPLHRLLFEDAPYAALVLTSGNLAEEPLCTANEEARTRLGGVADAFLLHDREIAAACDDSVARSTALGPVLLRRSRGWVPGAIRTPFALGRILAVGGHLKNTFCLTRGMDAYPSQHVGDLDDLRTLAFFEAQVERLGRLVEVEPEALACDLHPDYITTEWARERSERLGLPLVAVQHHHAHIAAVLAEHGSTEPVVGIACDGTGYGADGTVWGCELLLADLEGFERLAHLREAPLPGGEAAVREPWRMALAWCEAAGETAPFARLPHLAHRARDWEILRAAVRGGLAPVRASSAGRLFDAVSALLGIAGDRSEYEGQAAMRLETAAVACPLELPPLTLAGDGPPWALDPRPLVRALLDLRERGVAREELADAFHRAFAGGLVEAAHRLCEERGVRTVALSGGTFQNERVLVECVRGLERRGLAALWPRQMPPNDGGLALGQAVVAARRLAAGLDRTIGGRG